MKNMTKKAVYTITLALLLGGCKSTNTIYYWGDYSDTAYSYKHEPSEKTLNEHKEVLLEIIEKSSSKNKKIPPGIYAELAKIELDLNNIDGAMQLLEKERSLFPESTILVETIKKMISQKEVSDASVS